MAGKPAILDRWGRPLVRSELKREVAAATTTGVRSPLTSYPGDGLDPPRLAAILRAADAGDPVAYMELAETVEERNTHYLGILGTRRRSVSQLDITVEPGGDKQLQQDHAQEVRDWLGRDELAEELFDILDAVPKGYSFTETIWDSSMGQFWPDRLEHRDPRWFTFDRRDLRTPMMRSETGQPEPLPAFKFIFAQMKAKSGLPLRSGLARVAAWGWMFKAFTERDWAIFTQTYGQPLRLGKWSPGASEEDKNTLFRAVADIAGDCAGIIPDSMSIDFIEAGNLGAGSDLYIKRADWLDQQMSKAVLGQTATTDAIAGGHAVGREHRSVQEDIERADARALEAILNRDLVRPWMQLNHGPLEAYPRIRIARPEPEDLELLANSLGTLVPLGLQVGQEEVRAKFGLKAPGAGAPVLTPPAGAQPAGAMPPQAEDGAIERSEAVLKGGSGDPGAVIAAQAETAPTGDFSSPSPVGPLTDRLEAEAAPLMGAMLARVEAMVETASSLAELREMMLAGFDDLDETALARLIGAAMSASMAGGRIAAEEDAGG